VADAWAAPDAVAMTLAEALESTHLPRVAGRTGARTALVTTRPCRAPHHTIAEVGRIGGGQVPRPGDMSLAHHGVRCLGDRPAFRRRSLRPGANPRRVVSQADTLGCIPDLTASAARGETGDVSHGSAPTSLLAGEVYHSPCSHAGGRGTVSVNVVPPS
jgi:hypothetical protein